MHLLIAVFLNNAHLFIGNRKDTYTSGQIQIHIKGANQKNSKDMSMQNGKLRI